jgi:hypothetical protein
LDAVTKREIIDASEYTGEPGRGLYTNSKKRSREEQAGRMVKRVAVEVNVACFEP